VRKKIVLIVIIGCLISCSSFDWSALNQGMRNALVVQSELNLAYQFSGCILIAGNGTYLGKIANKYDSASIFNEYGEYGSAYSANSIWNKYGTYGSQYSSYSPFNPYTSTPPKVYKDGAFIGYLTVNKYMANSIDPYVLLSYFH
jgi:hypothetical protein